MCPSIAKCSGMLSMDDTLWHTVTHCVGHRSIFRHLNFRLNQILKHRKYLKQNLLKFLFVLFSNLPKWEGAFGHLIFASMLEIHTRKPCSCSWFDDRILVQAPRACHTTNLQDWARSWSSILHGFFLHAAQWYWAIILGQSLRKSFSTVAKEVGHLTDLIPPNSSSLG